MSAGGIDLWWFRLGEGAGDVALGFLAEAEKVRFRGFASPAAAAFFAFRRAARRAVLASYLDAPPASLRFREEPAGKPILAEPWAEIAFSDSHSGTTGVIAVSGGMPVGVDVELSRPVRAAGLAERILSPAERRAWQAADPAERDSLVLRAWTAKEAVVKGLGSGLDLAAFREITVLQSGARGEWGEATLGGRLSGQGPWHVWAGTLSYGQPVPAFVTVAASSPWPVDVIDARELLARHGLP